MKPIHRHVASVCLSAALSVMSPSIFSNPLTYDYIVVGAGAGGGPLASRLAERGFSVLLLEAGELNADDEEYSEIPALHVKASEREGLSWQYMIEHYSDPARAALDSKRCPSAPGCDPQQQGVFYPRGNTVGGSSAVNAMISVLPHDNDWNYIADQMNDPSWSAPSMREYLVRVEDNLYGRTNVSGHGTEGWLSINHNAVVSNDPGNSSLTTLPIEVQSSYTSILYGTSVAQGAGSYDYLGPQFPFTDVNRLRDTSIPSVIDPNDPNDPGFREALLPHEPIGMYQVPVAVNVDGRRSGVTGRILDVLDSGVPLTLQTNALVTQVVFDDSGAVPKAIGVKYMASADIYRADRQSDRFSNTPDPMPVSETVYASKEVILSAGAFNTPQLLMLSGIGPQDELAEHGIPIRKHLPGVGKNLQDRYEVPVIYKKRYLYSTTPMNFPALEMCSFDPSINDQCYSDWMQHGLGVYTQPGAISSMIKKSTELNMQLEEVADTQPSADPDLYLFNLGGTFKGYYPGYSEDTFDPDNQFTFLVLKGHSKNRGEVTLRSADPRDTPIINFKYFGDPQLGQAPSAEHAEDLDAVVKGIRLAREATDKATGYLNWASFATYQEIWPGAGIDTDEELRTFVMNESWGHHASCTAKIGPSTDPMAVLDSDFRVHGVERLRVVDASVFPEIPGFFPALSIYMLSEKAADVITDDATSL